MTRNQKIDASSLAQIFTDARSHRDFLDYAVPEDLLREAVSIANTGPTSCNSLPLRILFLRSVDAKERLLPCLKPHNVDQARAAPVVAIAAIDPKFYDLLPFLMPYADARPLFANDQASAEESGRLNCTLQVAYLIIALRAVGLDTCPIDGFNQDGVDKEFFGDNHYKSHLILNIGFGDASKLLPRPPRLPFDQMAEIA